MCRSLQADPKETGWNPVSRCFLSALNRDRSVFIAPSSVNTEVCFSRF